MLTKIRKCDRIDGHRLTFVDAKMEDAEFILGLRNNATKNKYLSPTSPVLDAQIAWMQKYAIDENQAYFIILHSGERIGTVRIYDQRDDSFCWGSWMMIEGAPSFAAIESALMVYAYAQSLGFSRAHFDVRIENSSVWKFHERFGAMRVGESEVDYFYEISSNEIDASFHRYRRYLPLGVTQAVQSS